MRYELGENIAVGGILPSGTTVTVEIIDMLTDSVVPLSDSSCIESAHIEGLYVWTTENISAEIVGYRVLFYRMTDGENYVQGKFVYGEHLTNISASIETIPDKVWDEIIA